MPKVNRLRWYFVSNCRHFTPALFKLESTLLAPLSPQDTLSPMYTPSQVARALGTTGTTIRSYAAEFAEFLSPSATPPAGKPRQFTDDDLAVLRTVYVMRRQLAPSEAILEALRGGVRLEPAAPAGAEDTQAEAATGAFSTALALFESRLDKAESRLEEERAARLAAELRAVAAETELRLIREASAEPRRMTFREWWASRKR